MCDFCCGLCYKLFGKDKSVESERQRLLSSPQLSSDGRQVPYGSFTPPELNVPEPQSDMDAMITDIIKVVENQVVDAGATDYTALDSQEYIDRSRHYLETVYHRQVGAPLVLPRTFGNPASIIEAPVVSIAEVKQMQEIAKHVALLVQNMAHQEKNDLIAHFNHN